MRIGIYAPYDRSETTEAALMLANLASRSALSVGYLAGGGRHAKVDSHWDERVESVRDSNVARWAQRHDWCVWFTLQPRRYAQARDATAAARHVLVPVADQSVEQRMDLLSSFDHVVFPTRDAYEKLGRYVAPLEHAHRVSWRQWSSSGDIAQRQGPQQPGQVRVLAFLDAQTLRGHGELVLEVAGKLLTNMPHLHMSLAAANSWPRHLKKRSDALIHRYGSRYRCYHRLSPESRSCQLFNHDWLWLPNLRSDTGAWVVKALDMGVPVLAFDVPPFNEAIIHDYNGALILCEKEKSWCLSWTAVWDSLRVMQAATAAWSSEKTLTKLHSNEWERSRVRDNFRSTWLNTWNLG
jgi:hypothetical protein